MHVENLCKGKIKQVNEEVFEWHLPIQRETVYWQEGTLAHPEGTLIDGVTIGEGCYIRTRDMHPG